MNHSAPNFRSCLDNYVATLELAQNKIQFNVPEPIYLPF